MVGPDKGLNYAPPFKEGYGGLRVNVGDIVGIKIKEIANCPA